MSSGLPSSADGASVSDSDDDFYDAADGFTTKAGMACRMPRVGGHT